MRKFVKFPAAPYRLSDHLSRLLSLITIKLVLEGWTCALVDGIPKHSELLTELLGQSMSKLYLQSARRCTPYRIR